MKLQISSIWPIITRMTNKADLERVYFHNYQKHLRTNNPTYVSSLVNDSLTLFTPAKIEKKEPARGSEYATNFQPFGDKINLLGWAPTPHNYAKYSKEAFEKSRSHLSQYASNLLCENRSELVKK